MINVAVSGAAGRMGQTVCDAVEGRMTWLSSAAPIPSSRPLIDVLGDADVVVDFSTPGHRTRERTPLHRGGCIA